MRSPSIIPGFNADVYLVLDDFAQLGRAYHEVDEDKADRQTLIRREGQYKKLVRIVAFNTAEGWARDVTAEIARENRDRADRSGDQLSAGLQEFIETELDRATRRQS
jgi:hypothetical protein